MAFDAIKKILPSKKVALGILAVIITAGIVVLSIHYKKKADIAAAQPFGATIPAVPEEILKQSFDVDTDQDGVSDWEEALWATDPRQKDSDGDGVSDGAFVANQKAKMQLEMPSSVSIKPESETEVFDRQFYSTIAYLDQSGQLTPEREQSLSDIYTTYAIQPTAVSISRSDLKIITNETVNIKNYVVLMNDFLGKNELIPSSVVDLMQAVRFGSVPDTLYQSIVVPYGRLIENLKKTPVPERFADNHLALLNAMAVFKVGVLDGLGRIADEPMYTLRAVAQFKASGQAVIDAINSMGKALSTAAYY